MEFYDDTMLLYLETDASRGLEKSHHYCFSREVLVITDHKLLVSMLKKIHSHIVTVHAVHTAKYSPI